MNPEKTLKIVRFGDFSFDYESALLRKKREIVYLRPNAARLLAALLESPNTVVRHEHLRKVIWGNRVVEWQMGLHGLIRDIRRALEDDPRSPRYLQTIPRRGYRFRIPESADPAKSGVDLFWPRIGWFTVGVLTLPAVVIAACLYLGLTH